MVAWNVGILKTAIPYIKAYKNKVFVVKLGGALCTPGKVLDDICEQLSLLYQLGIKLVVVHGGGNHATKLAEALEVESEFIKGRRVTSADMLEVVKMSLAGTVNTNIVSSLRQQDIPAAGLSGIDAGLITAKKRPPVKMENNEEVDYGHVGDIVETDVGVITQLHEGNFVPVICSLGADENGEPLNINADTVAAMLASELKVTKYLSLTTVDGILGKLDDPSTLYSVLSPSQAKELIQDGTLADGMLPKVEACLYALDHGVCRAHIVNGTDPDGILKEVFTNEGCGTLIGTGGELPIGSAG